MKTTNPKLDKDFETIVDCLTGADGGVSFVRLQGFIEEMEKRANADDTAADQVLTIVYRFANLIRLANKLDK